MTSQKNTKQNNTLYITSDQHFYHSKIIEYCKRPFKSVEEMNSKILENYNNIIKKDDIVIHLGDLSATVKTHIEEFKEILKSLNGKKILLRGNHDHLPDQFYLDCGFEVVGDHMIVGDYFFSHYPLYKKSKWCTEPEKRLIKLYENSNCTKIIHGHTHNNVLKWDDNKFRINACVEMNNYNPVKITL